MSELAITVRLSLAIGILMWWGGGEIDVRPKLELARPDRAADDSLQDFSDVRLFRTSVALARTGQDERDAACQRSFPLCAPFASAATAVALVWFRIQWMVRCILLSRQAREQ